MNIFSKKINSQSDEVADTLYFSQNTKVERIISMGHKSPDGFWYNQSEDEFVILVQGSAKLEFENNEEICLEKGDSLLIPAYKKHRIIYTSINPQCIWICIFSKK